MYSVNQCHSITNHDELLCCWWENQQVIAWKRVLAKFINDLSREEHHPSGHPPKTHPSPDWSLGFGLYSPQGKFAGTYFVIEKIDIFTTFRSIYIRP
jgi:hypothetical protein